MHQCNRCHKIIRTVADVRNCTRCQDNGHAASIPTHHDDTDYLTPMLVANMITSSHYSSETPAPDYSGGGGSFGGAGASSSWDSGSSSSSSYDSSSSSSSSDSGSSSGGGSD